MKTGACVFLTFFLFVNAASSKEKLEIFKSLDHCPTPGRSGPVWSLYPIKDGEVIAENTVAGLTAKYLGCRSAYWKNEQDKVLTGKPKTGHIGIAYTEYEYTKGIQIKMGDRNVSRTVPAYDGSPMYFLVNYNFISMKITSDLRNIESMVLFDVQAERGCTNGNKPPVLIKNYNFKRDEKITPIDLFIHKLCTRDYSITSRGEVVNLLPYELIFLVRAKTYDNKYYFTVKKFLLARDSNR